MWPALLIAALASGCSAGGPGTEVSERHDLPNLPDLDSVLLPAGFASYEATVFEYSSRDPIHVDTGYFGYDRSVDFGGNETCPAQITVSPHDPDVQTPEEYVDLLGTSLCDATWSQSPEPWRSDPDDEHLWFTEASYYDGGFFGGDHVPAFGMVLFDPDHGVIVGLWAKADVYRPDQAEAVLRDVAESVGG